MVVASARVKHRGHIEETEKIHSRIGLCVVGYKVTLHLVCTFKLYVETNLYFLYESKV